MSHGTVYEKKEKHISEETREYIHKLVNQVNRGKYGQGSLMTSPFHEAYPALNDLCSLYAVRKTKKITKMERHRLQAIANRVTRMNQKYDLQLKQQKSGENRQSVMQRAVDKLFNDVLEIKRHKLVKSIN